MSKSFLLVVGGTLPSTCSGYVTFVSPEAFAYLVLSGRRNLTVATLPARMASGTVFVPLSNGGNIIQMAPGFPSVPLQASGAIPYPQYGAQQLGIPTNAPQRVPQKGPLERFFSADPKVLGFISSGSVCVAAAKRPNRHLVKSSVGLNITSAIMSLSGSILHICDLIFISLKIRYHCNDLDNVVCGLLSMLLLFSLLEFCIAVPLAHFGCWASCCSDDQPTMLYVPYQVIEGGEVTAEPNPPPSPTYNSMVTKSQ
ncbi:membrane-spanning 4-domains subfamily A member 8-like isoform X2 [Erythrolamprus reginae]|uniref:membrane-spanning 4-domains subfamily A member 8-like isoform X2 n=1 Tax=Erythrolamprus reginae TaxID=121349 RepID=UPI00396CF897